jgi:endonuclease/exonuclease/phosphatase family metal-dependent hydrolase
LKTTGKIVKYLFIPVNVIAVLILWLSGLSAYVDPIKFVFPAFLGLAYPFVLLLNLGFILLWLFLQKKYVLISLLGIIIGYQAFSKFFQVNFNTDKPEKTTKIMTYNVRLFDLYNWSHNKETRNKIFDLLKSENADIYCFQEFYQVDKKGAFTTRDTMATFLKANKYREAYTHKMRGDQYFGVATFTVYPIVNSGVIKFSNDINNVCLFIDLEIDKDTIRVYNMHIASIRFSYDDYDFIAKADYRQDEKELKKGFSTIYHRLSDAFVKRSVQTKIVLSHIEKSPYPVIVCGDFNDSPISYCYQSFSDQLIDSFKEAGNGIGNTYVGAMPSYRIDYVFHSNEFKATGYSTLKQKLSDHFPVMVEISLKNKSYTE